MAKERAIALSWGGTTTHIGQAKLSSSFVWSRKVVHWSHPGSRPPNWQQPAPWKVFRKAPRNEWSPDLA